MTLANTIRAFPQRRRGRWIASPHRLPPGACGGSRSQRPKSPSRKRRGCRSPTPSGHFLNGVVGDGPRHPTGFRRGLVGGVARNAPKAPRGSDGDDAHQHHPGISSTASWAMDRVTPPASAGGLWGESLATPQKPLAEATGMTLANTIRAFPQRRRGRWIASPHRLPPGACGGRRCVAGGGAPFALEQLLDPRAEVATVVVVGAAAHEVAVHHARLVNVDPARDLPVVEEMVRDPELFLSQCSKPVLVFDEIHQLRRCSPPASGRASTGNGSTRSSRATSSGSLDFAT